MKRIICFMIVIILVSSLSLAENIDLSNMSLRELVLLRKQVLNAIWNSNEWQEVIVPPGVWEIGSEIPPGHWSITPAEGLGPDYVIYGCATKDQGHDIDLFAGEYIMECVCNPSSKFYSGEYKTTTDIEMEEGHFVRLDCTMIFSPFIGKPSFGFK